MFAVVDTGALVAAAVESDPSHAQVAAALLDAGLDYIIPAMCVAEAAYLIARELGPEREAVFLESLASADVIAPEGDDWVRIGALVRRYGDFPLGGTDASVVALAERLDTDVIVTLDQRHFRAIRPRHCEFFRLLPEL